MPHFIRRLACPQGQLNFYFNRIYAADGLRYHISVTDKEKKTYSFSMKQVRDEWLMMGKKACPEWLVELEETFELAIRQHLAEPLKPDS